MKYCTQCGERVSESDLFCGGCGNKIKISNKQIIENETVNEIKVETVNETVAETVSEIVNEAVTETVTETVSEVIDKEVTVETDVAVSTSAKQKRLLDRLHWK